MMVKGLCSKGPIRYLLTTVTHIQHFDQQSRNAIMYNRIPQLLTQTHIDIFMTGKESGRGRGAVSYIILSSKSDLIKRPIYFPLVWLAIQIENQEI